MAEQLYDVVAVRLGGGPYTVRVIERDKTLGSAEAVVKMAVMRRGVSGEFFAEVPAGRYRDGDEWGGA
jgi:hypothetical protein